MKRRQIQIGQLSINFPDENQNCFSIFEDMADLFGTDYQSEAVAMLKRKLMHVKPKPSIDHESDFTSIRTGNIDTMIVVVKAIIELSVPNYKNTFSQINETELKKQFTEAKKNRPKPRQWETGDIFSIPLRDNTFSFGQVLDKKYCTCALFAIHSASEIISSPEFRGVHPISILHIGRDLLNNGTWKVLFNEQVTLSPNSGTGGKFGDIGSSSYGSGGILTDLAEAYYGLTPWNIMFDEDYYDKKLVDGVTRPANVMILNPTERAQYRKETMGIEP